jgi:uncharacterized membrane protein
MTDRLLVVLIIFSALGSGLIGGVFFAFSTFVMKALSRLPASQGVAAMQSINVVVINPWFLSVFLGTALTSLLLVVVALVDMGKPGAVLLLVGGLFYFVGTFLVTMLFHVPRNNALATLDPAASSAVESWDRYCTSWSAGNHVRTGAALIAATLLTIACWFLRAAATA